MVKSIAKFLILMALVFNPTFAFCQPPREVPLDLIEEFTMNGLVPIVDYYFNNEFQAERFYSRTEINEYIKRVKKKETFYYGQTDKWLYEALEKYPILNKKVLIIGSTIPWYESIILAYRGIPYTVDYNTIHTDDHRLNIIPIADLDESMKFDFILSISSIEHDGLGRYGDPINPNGDLKFMSEAKKYLKPKGIMFMAVPMGRDSIAWNAHRVYGSIRFPLLIQEWNVLDKFGYSPSKVEQGKIGDGNYQPVFCLTQKQ